MRIKANKITQHFKIKLKNSLLHWKMKIRGTKFSFSFDSPKKNDLKFSWTNFETLITISLFNKVFES